MKWIKIIQSSSSPTFPLFISSPSLFSGTQSKVTSSSFSTSLGLIPFGSFLSWLRLYPFTWTFVSTFKQFSRMINWKVFPVGSWPIFLWKGNPLHHLFLAAFLVTSVALNLASVIHYFDIRSAVQPAWPFIKSRSRDFLTRMKSAKYHVISIDAVLN